MRPSGTALILAAGAVATTAAGFAAGIPLLLPVLGAAVPFAIFFPRVRDGRLRAAWGWVLFWALFQSVAVGGAASLAPERAREVVIRGDAYATEMLRWVRTGEGAEGSPRLFLPVHLRHYVAFCVLSLITAGGAGLLLGTILLNYMNVYVAALVGASAHPGIALLFGWPVWAALRVAGFVASGTALASYGFALLDRARGRPPRRGFPARFFLMGLALVAADALLKACLAPLWRGILVRALAAG